MENIYAPIVLFTYRRIPKKTIESLLLNDLAPESSLFIYSDGHKNEVDKVDVEEVREYLNSIKGFQSVKIIKSDKNKGLANSIIAGVTEVINQYSKVIVLEDDLIVSANLLKYMNDALDFYKNDKKIWSIAGYGPKLPCLENYEKDLYLSPRGSSWGWGSWFDRWNSVDWSAKKFEVLKKNKQLRKKFELGGDDMYRMLELQILGEIDSWAVRWCFSQFLQDKYTVYPVNSKIINDGFNDPVGSHFAGYRSKWDVKIQEKKIIFENLQVNPEILLNWKNYHDLSFPSKIGYFLNKHGGFKLIKFILKTINFRRG